MWLSTNILIWILVIGIFGFSHAFFDPITGIAGGIAVGLGLLNIDFLKENTYCKFSECCIAPYLKTDIDGLRRQLQHRLFGQHIVQETLINALGGHFRNIKNSRKPLVMSFDGTTGTGKNFVSDFVVTSLYEKGFQSKYVHKFTADFWITNPSFEIILVTTIKEAVKKCPHSLFIFDETQKMPKGAFDSIVTLLDHHYSHKGYDFSKAIFIFLSNSVEIARKLKSIIDSGRWRDKTTLQDFERIAELGAYNMLGGLQESGLISSHVIDHFVPFLPLEPRHVEQCIKQEFEQFCPFEVTDQKISDVVRMAVTLDETGTFQNNGCKRISKKVEALCYS
ncbi:torsin-like protein isoform X2 [Topomyia yanbarensis]|uniref:torsin-like protein isoform X2 n=1 Tax=Topomyia yanbarensis TaxID=2498891 RepID=UPI00273B5F72|nr:torsin-like protein isoform X2 [Topomyia yanbarensis]